jgi:hypothetical protein
MAGAFVPKATNTTTCGDISPKGTPSTRYDYILKSSTGDTNYPVDACTPYLHYNVQMQNLRIDMNLERVINITGSGQCQFPTFIGNLTGVASGNKTLASFDIPHVKDKGKRIRHIVAEGPEPGIYIRGKLKDTNVIELPEYWDGLIDPESITVTLTQIGYSQDLIVDKIEWGKKVIVKSGNGANIHCYYEVWAARWLNPMNHDEKLQVVYEGETPDDYPGGNENFLIGGWDYDRRNPQWSVSGGNE